MTALPTQEIARLAERYTPEMVRFLRDMIAIPSESAGEQRGRRARPRRRWRRAGFDEVKIDGLGNILGRVGSGKTGRRGDRRPPRHGGRRRRAPRGRAIPYQRRLCSDGVIYGRGASATRRRASRPPCTARASRRSSASLDGVQLWVTGTVMEEDCDGLCWQYILQEKVLKPDVVVDHRADESRRLSRAPGPNGDRGADAGPLVPRLGARARRQRGLQDGARHRRHRAARTTGSAATADPFLGKGSVHDLRDPVHLAVALRRGRQRAPSTWTVG